MLYSLGLNGYHIFAFDENHYLDSFGERVIRPVGLAQDQTELKRKSFIDLTLVCKNWKAIIQSIFCKALYIPRSFWNQPAAEQIKIADQIKATFPSTKEIYNRGNMYKDIAYKDWLDQHKENAEDRFVTNEDLSVIGNYFLKDHPTITSLTAAGNFSSAAFGVVSGLAPHLKEVALSFPNLPEIGNSLLTLLEGVSTLEKLTLLVSGETDEYDMEGAFTKLQKNHKKPFNLKHLEINLGYDTGSSYSGVYLADRSRRSVRGNFTLFEPNVQGIKDLSIVFPHLQTLAMYEICCFNELETILTSFKSLQELIIEGDYNMPHNFNFRKLASNLVKIQIPNLKKLSLYCNLDDLCTYSLVKALPNLEELKCYWFNLTDSGLLFLNRLPLLKRLEVTLSNGLTEKGWEQFFKSPPPNIETLYEYHDPEIASYEVASIAAKYSIKEVKGALKFPRNS
ncbi:MAG: hypothetical protein K0S74_1833 [Chlamydiales bacterium]|nr:hypothetical protein [Chlamydiales bacterium]